MSCWKLMRAWPRWTRSRVEAAAQTVGGRDPKKRSGCLAKAEKQAVSETDRDQAVTERAFELTSEGPFDAVIHVDGGNVPSERISISAACDVIGQAGIDRQHQTRLVILDSRWFSLFNGDDTVTRKAIASAMGRGSSRMSVQWASSAVVCGRQHRDSVHRPEVSPRNGWHGNGWPSFPRFKPTTTWQLRRSEMPLKHLRRSMHG